MCNSACRLWHESRALMTHVCSAQDYLRVLGASRHLGSTGPLRPGRPAMASAHSWETPLHAWEMEGGDGDGPRWEDSSDDEDREPTREEAGEYLVQMLLSMR
eukprot:14633118-Alexandrium_andersonii.AAC.1